MIAFGTWKDRAYETIPKGNKWERVNWQQQRLIEEKYPNPTKAPKEYADVCNWQARSIVAAEDEQELALDDRRKGQ